MKASTLSAAVLLLSSFAHAQNREVTCTGERTPTGYLKASITMEGAVMRSFRVDALDAEDRYMGTMVPSVADAAIEGVAPPTPREDGFLFYSYTGPSWGMPPRQSGLAILLPADWGALSGGFASTLTTFVSNQGSGEHEMSCGVVTAE